MFPLLVLSLTGLVVMLGQGMVSPILPLYGRSFGVGAAVVGFLVTAFGLARVLTDLPAGYLSERFGAGRVLLLGPAITAAASLMAGLAGSFWLLVFWRFWQGVGSALFTTAAMARVAELSPPGRTAKNLALFQGFHLLGTSFGPSLGGWVAQYGGYRAPFFFFAGLAAAGVLAAGVGRRRGRKAAGKNGGEESPAGAGAGEPGAQGEGQLSIGEDRGRQGEKAEVGRKGEGISRLLANRQFLLITMVNFSIFFARAGARQTIVPLLGAAELGLKEGQIGFALTLIALGNLSMVYLAGWLGDRCGVRQVLVPGILLASGGYFLFAASADYTSYLLAAAVVGLGTGLGGPLPAAYAVQVAGQAGHGVVMGAIRFFGDTGFMAGPVALGLIADALGYRAALVANALLMASLALAFAVLAARSGHGAGEAEAPGQGRPGSA